MSSLPTNIISATALKEMVNKKKKTKNEDSDRENKIQEQELFEAVKLGFITDIETWTSGQSYGIDSYQTEQRYKVNGGRFKMPSLLLDEWETKLTNSGYIITREGDFFIVSLP